MISYLNLHYLRKRLRKKKCGRIVSTPSVKYCLNYCYRQNSFDFTLNYLVQHNNIILIK